MPYDIWICRIDREYSREDNFGSREILQAPPGQNVRHFADDIFKRIFLNENGWILTEISMKIVPKNQIYNKHSLV